MGATDGPGPFGILLQQYRAAAGLSQEELAARARLSRRGISDLERGQRRLPHPATVRRLAGALNLDDAERASFVASIHTAPAPDNTDGRVLEAYVVPLPAARSQPATTAARRPTLPASLSSFVGRDQELTELVSAIETTRLLTLTGPGGVGKTRLALQLAQLLESRFRDGAAFVALAPIPDATLVVPTIAQMLGKERDGARVPGEVVEALFDKQLLLVLDNFEHVLEAAPAITALLEACPGLKVLVTSRAPLRVRGEQEFAVPPLRLPDRGRSLDPTTLSQFDAVRLFAERARSVEPHFSLTDLNAAAVAEICRRLDGLPLAMELAAARIRLLSPQGMLSFLEQRLIVLIGGARDLPARQQTLRATFAWSYDLLEPAEQKLFQRLSVFVGGFTMAAVRSVAGGQRPSGGVPQEGEHTPRPLAVAALDGDVLQLLESLVAMSMVQREGQPDGEQRFSILETIREFGLEHLAESGEEGALRRRHASAYLTFAEPAKQELSGPNQGVWLARLEAEQGNLRAAFDACEANRETERAARFLEALHWFWLVHGHLTEGGERAARVATLAAATERPDLQPRARPCERTRLPFERLCRGLRPGRAQPGDSPCRGGLEQAAKPPRVARRGGIEAGRSRRCSRSPGGKHGDRPPDWRCSELSIADQPSPRPLNSRQTDYAGSLAVSRISGARRETTNHRWAKLPSHKISGRLPCDAVMGMKPAGSSSRASRFAA